MVGDVTGPETAGQAPGDMPASIGRTVFRIGEGDLILDTEDQAFTRGFRRIYGDCERTTPQAPLSARLAVTPFGDAVHVDVLDPPGVDLVSFLETAFSDRGCRRDSCDEPGWTGLSCDSPNVRFRVREQRVTFRADGPWEGIAANLGLGLVMRQQRDVVFLHASTVMLAGTSRGLVFVGQKAAGKTTTALGLAMRGHEFLGDEVVGIRHGDGSLLPIRRAISKREGPC